MPLPILGKKGKAASSKLAARLEYSVVEGWLIAIGVPIVLVWYWYTFFRDARRMTSDPSACLNTMPAKKLSLFCAVCAIALVSGSWFVATTLIGQRWQIERRRTSTEPS